MKEFKIYKLHFTAPLHIGNQQANDDVSLTTIQSDTMYAALTACLAKMGHPIAGDGDLGVTLSSLFPYFQKEEDSTPVYFLPLPLRNKQLAFSNPSQGKAIKKVKWVDADLYDDILSGKKIFEEGDSLLKCVQASYLTRQELPEDLTESRDFIKSEVSQCVTLKSRTGEEDAKPYYVDKILFRFQSGLYFLAEGDTATLERALNLLASEGIGTDRNVGFGFFEYTTDTLRLNLPSHADHQMALSMLIPESEAQLQSLLDDDDVAYDFIRRGGWITTYPYMTLRKNAVYAFTPGSVFHKTAREECTPVGAIVNLVPNIGDSTPQHPIWRCGRSLMLPIKL